VLDIGCGTGGLTFTLPEIANVATVTGIDLTERFVEFGRAHNKDSRISFATLVDYVRRAYLANLPDGPRSFACVAWACRGTMPL
jgi:2-polyprenyl-3-methyl-5-hydroxy-6-metoxy-1,4-benzoquinol methylase